jgi:hypothetical protein
MEETNGMDYTADEVVSGGETSAEECAGEQREDGCLTPESSKEAARLINVIRNLKRENGGTETAVESPSDADGGKSEHPALAGLEKDESGNVLYHGSYVSPEFAIEHFEQAKRLEEMEGALKVRDEAERESRVEAAQKELFGVVQAAIVEMREESLPGLGKEHAALADEYILSQADFVLTRALASGEELTPELIERSGRDALAKAKQLFGIFGERQIADNREYAETYRVKPDGRPGTRAPINESRLTKAERIRLAQERTRLAMAMRKNG